MDFTSSSSSDEELIELVRMTRAPKIYKERKDNFLIWDEEEFHNRFRLNKRTVTTLLTKIENNLKFTSNRNKCLSPINQILLTLRFYATGCMLLTTGDFCGVSKATAGRIVTKVSFEIASLSRDYIKMPVTEQEKLDVVANFYNICQFPCVIGTIDCTHIKIQSPGGEDAEVYRNRKGYFSYNVQTISDSKLRIRNIVARWPGSCHDQTIFNNSAVKTKFENGDFGNKYVLLGDNGYTCTNYVITPLLSVHNEAEQAYNKKHIRTRNTVERQYGVWKRRFPALSLGIRLSSETAKTVIVVTAV